MRTGYTQDRETFKWADVLRAVEEAERRQPVPEPRFFRGLLNALGLTLLLALIAFGGFCFAAWLAGQVAL